MGRNGMGRNGYGPKWSWAEMVMGRNDPEPVGFGLMFDKDQKQSSTLSCDSSYQI